MMSKTSWLWMGTAAIVLLTAIAYIPAMRGGFIWDDDDYIINRTVVHDRAGLDDIWFVPGATPQYYPIVFTSFWIEHKLWGLQPTGYHIVNVALHIINSLLVWLILKRLGLGEAVAWVAAAVFAVHPVHVESVAWITERKNVLSGAFYLAALLLGVRVFRLDSEDRPAPQTVHKSGARRKSPTLPTQPSGTPVTTAALYVAMLALFTTALLSKTVTCSLPAAVLLLIWWKRARVTQYELLALVPMLIIGAVMALKTIEVEKAHVGVEVLEFDLSFIERCLIAGRALWFYAWKLIWPDPIVFIYPQWHIRAEFWWLYLYPFGVLVVVTGLWLLRGRIGRGPLVAVLIFCGTLVPALGFIDVFPMVYSYVADHFQYLASISLIVLFVATAARLLARRPLARTMIAAAVLFALGTVTWRAGGKYENLLTLWTDTIHRNDRAAMAHINLAGELNLLDTTEAWEQARQHYEIVLTTDDPAIHPMVLSRAHYGMGKYWLEVNNIHAALDEFRSAVQLMPKLPLPHYGVGHALAILGRPEEALSSYNRALELKPDFQQAQIARQLILDQKQKSGPTP